MQTETEETITTRRSRARWLWIAVVLIPVLAAVVVLVWLEPRTPNKPPSNAPPGSAIASAPFTLRLNGKTEAVRSRAILAPLVAGQQVGTLTIVKLIPSGTRVKQGDLLVEFDQAGGDAAYCEGLLAGVYVGD